MIFMLKRKTSASIIVPTYNEKESIESLFSRIKGVMKKAKLNYEIILGDSDSKDGTIEIAKQTARKLKIKLKAINTGKTDLSGAVLNALKYSSYNLVVVIDADLQHPPEAIPIMIKELRYNDVVIGSRFVKGAKYNYSFFRLILSKGFQTLAKIVVPKTNKIKDVSAGFFAFNKKIIENVRLNPIGYKIMLEMLAKGNIDMKKVKEIPINFKKRERGQSKLTFKQIRLAAKHLTRLSRTEWKKWFQFIVVGGTCAIFNEALLWLFTDIAKIHYLFSGIIAIELSIIYNFIFNDIWTFKSMRKGNFFKRFLKFNFVRGFAVLLNLGALWFFTTLGLHYLVSNLIGIIIATIVSYLSSVWWVWK